MEGFIWVVEVIGQLFGVFDITLLGIPIYAYFVMAFIFTLLAKFLHARR